MTHGFMKTPAIRLLPALLLMGCVPTIPIAKLALGQGSGSPMELEVPLPWSGVGHWRLRVAP